jgi:hypothetical protein
MAGETQTVVDGGAARDSARDSWKASTMQYFRRAADEAERDPERSLELIRKALEGWGHVVSCVLDPDFRPYDGKELRREQLAVVLRRAREHLPPDRRDALALLKTLGDSAHHNQGQVQRSSRRFARATVLQCADLLEWMYSEVLREPVPVELHEPTVALPVQTPLPGTSPQMNEPAARTLRERWKGVLLVAGLFGLLIGTILAAFCGPSASSSEPSETSAWPAAARTIGSGRAVISTSAETVVRARPSVQGSSASEKKEQNSRADLLELVRAYETAIVTRDVDAILALQAFPATRWFKKRNASREDVRQMYLHWFETETRRVLFENCVVVAPTAVQCQLQHDPPFEEDPDGAPMCLAFDPGGKLRERFLVDATNRCPL